MEDSCVAAMDISSNRQSFDEDSDDEVIAEMDVFLSKGQADSLYLLQYPLRPSDYVLSLGIEHNLDISCEFKPKQEKLQIKLPLDASSSSYDKGRGEQIAINCGASSSATPKGKAGPFEKRMDYQNLVSSNISGFHKNCYAAGYVQDGQLHLTPLKNVLQMRPNFSYLDAADVRSSKSAVSSRVDAAGESSQDESETEAGPSGAAAVQTVRVKFKEESEYLRKRREASYQYQQKLRDEEAWIPLNYIPSHDPVIQNQRRSLAGNIDLTHPDASAKCLPCVPRAELTFSSSPSQLLRLLVPKAEEQKRQPAKLPCSTISLNRLRELPLSDQVRTLMTNVKVMRFAQLLSLLPPKADIATVLTTLQQCAQLVRGCWVVKSDILHPKGSFSPRTGASADLLCSARDYAMYRFTQTTTLTRREVAHAVKIPNEDIDDILKQLAKFKAQSGWHFVYPADVDFTQTYQEIAQQQAAKWEAKLKDFNFTAGRQRNFSSSVASPNPVRRRRTASARNSGTDSAGEGETGLMSPPPMTSKSRSRSRSTSGPRSMSKAKVNTTIQQQTANGSDLGIHLDTNTCSELKNFLYDAFRSKPVLSLAKIQKLLQLKLSELPKGHPLANGIDERAIEQCAVQLGAAKFENSRQADPSDRFFVFAEGSWPEIRTFLIKFLQEKSRGKKEKASFRLNAFKQACANSFASDYSMPSDVEMKELISEYCILKAGGYYVLQDT